MKCRRLGKAGTKWAMFNCASMPHSGGRNEGVTRSAIAYHDLEQLQNSLVDRLKQESVNLPVT